MIALRIEALGVAFVAACSFAAAPLQNPSFEQGEKEPAGWRLEGEGAWETTGRSGRRSISVTGAGKDSSFWRTTDCPFEPSTLYRVSFWTSADRSAEGCVISGPSFCNRDFRAAAGWQRHSFVFTSPAKVGDAYLRFGQWWVPTKVSFDDVELKPTQAVHERFGDIVLGDGESVAGTSYVFYAPLGGEGANYSRPLVSFDCGFNSNRWCFHNGAEVIYRHAISGHRQTAGSVEVNCGYYSSGTGYVDVSADGKSWTNVARFESTGSVRADLPAALLPAEALFIRLRASGREADTRNSKPGDFQIYEYRYTATLDASLGNLYGATAFPDVQAADPQYPAYIESIPTAEAAGDKAARLSVGNLTDKRATLDIVATVTSERGEAESSRVRAHVQPGEVAMATLPCDLRQAGTNTITLSVRHGREEVYRASAQRFVAMLHDASYGYAIPSEGPCALWWCEGTYKVSQARALPSVERKRIEIAAARHEYEPFQLVLRPTKELHDVRVRVTPLNGRKGAVGVENVRVDRVAYLEVVRPTDSAGVRGWWPDPLPPFEQGATLEAGRNHPLWITVYVPPDQPAGDYEGSIELSAAGWQATVPLRLRVWDFALPKASHMQTGFGLDPHNIKAYHNLETTEELRKVLDLYLESFAAHRIAPYSPALLDPYKVEFSTGPWDGGSLDSKDLKEGKACLRVEDNDPRSSIAAHNAKLIAVDVAKGYRFSWWAKTAKPGQQYAVTLQQHDAEGRWISGNNMDLVRTGSGEWQREEVAIGPPDGRPFNPTTRLVNIGLRPVPWTEAGEGAGTAWFDDVRLEPASGGPNLLTDGGFEAAAEELKAAIDFTAFDRECEKWLDRYGFNALNVTLHGMGGGTFQARSLGRIGSYPQGTPEYEKLMASQGRQLVEHLRAKGWLDKAYMYWFDEPDKKDYEFVVEGMEIIKRAAPGLTRMLTEQPEPELVGHVDLWCAVVSAYDPKIGSERQKAGDRFWWYLCCGPHAPYIGLFIDHPAVDLRVWAWLSRKWGMVGQLVWTSNYWTSPCAYPPPDTQNPWQDPMSYVSGYDYKPGQIAYWGNGDGRFLYPPNRDAKNDKEKHLGGPVSSLRWEMLREGIEDYEYFKLLDGLVAEAKKRGTVSRLVRQAEQLALVPDEVIKDDKTYSKDPQPLHAHRRKVAEMVERLSQALH